MSIILCADDFGQNKKISQGILQLTSKNRLSAISCMTQMPHWNIFALDLLDLKKSKNHIQLGIHFNLTHLSNHSLFYWMRSSMMGMVDRQTIQTTFNQQCDAFEKIAKQEPEFIDGHQHVHSFPIIRDIIIDILKRRYAHKMPYVRNLRISPTQKSNLKTSVLSTMSYGFKKLLMDNNIAHNDYFAGIYDLDPNNKNYKQLLQSWFESVPSNTLIMCHPGLLSQDQSDPIAATRFKEFEILSSDWFYDNYGPLIAIHPTF